MNLAERIAKFWENATVGQATKATDRYIAKALARLNELLARLNAKK